MRMEGWTRERTRLEKRRTSRRRQWRAMSCEGDESEVRKMNERSNPVKNG
jgi:hypothetical protein